MLIKRLYKVTKIDLNEKEKCISLTSRKGSLNKIPIDEPLNVYLPLDFEVKEGDRFWLRVDEE